MAFDLFINSLWLINFVINLNRVDFIRKITTFKETSRQYLRKWLIPDLIALSGSVAYTILKQHTNAKYFELIRLLRF